MSEEQSTQLKDHVKGTSRFTHFQVGELHYITTDTGFEFIVPVAETLSGRFGAEERSTLMMKFIKAQIERNKSYRTEFAKTLDQQAKREAERAKK